MPVFDILAKLRIDKGDSDSVFTSIGEKLGLIHHDATIPVKVDTAASTAGLDALQEKVSVQVQSINEWKTKLAELKTQRDAAEDSGKLADYNARIAVATEQIKAMQTPVKEAFNPEPVKQFEAELEKIPGHMHNAESGVSGFAAKSKEELGHAFSLGNVAEFATGGLAAGGITEIAGEFLNKAKEMRDANDSLSIGLSKSGLSAAEMKDELERLDGSTAKIAEDFALPGTQVKTLAGEIAGFSGLAGDQLDHLTEISLGASKALQMAPEAIARMIAKGADPEAQANLARIGIRMDANSTAAERMAAISQKLGPAIDASKAATNDATHNLDRLKNTVEETALGFASSIFEGIGPIFSALVPIFKILGEVLGAVGKPLGELIGALAGPLGSILGLIAVPLKFVAELIGTVLTTAIGGAKKEVGGIVDVFMGLIHLDFQKTWEGIKKFGSGLIDLVPGVTVMKSLAESVGLVSSKDDELKEKAKTAGEAGVKAAKDATASQEDLTAAIDASVKGWSDFQAGVKQGVDNSLASYALIQKRLKDGGAMFNGAFLPDDAGMRDKLNGLLAQWTKYGKDQEALKKQNDKFNQEANDAILGKEKAGQTDLLAQAKQKAQFAADTLNIELQRLRIAQGVAFSSSDELAVQQKLNSTFEEQVTTLGIVAAAAKDKKLSIGLDTERATEDLAKAKLEAKVQIDAVKLAADVQTAIDAGVKSEIELGIRPKSDNLELFDQQREEIKQKFESLTFDPLDPNYLQNVQLAAAQEYDALLGVDAAQKAFADAQTAAAAKNAHDIAQLRIDLMDDGLDKESMALDLKYREDVAAAQGNEEKIALLKQKYLKDAAALTAKNAKDELSAFAVTKDGLLTLYKDLIAERKALSDAEIADKIRGYDDEQTALQQSLQKGELSVYDYNAKLGKLAQDRADFETTVNDQHKSAIEKSYDDLSQKAIDSFKNEAAEYAASKTAEVLAHLLGEETKTVATQEGTAIRIVSLIAEEAASLAVAGANMVAAGASELWEAIVSLGPIAGPVVGVASVGAIIAAYLGFKGQLGFEQGGLGFVGENGVEVMAPVTDFSQFATMLVERTAQTTERAIRNRPNGGAGQNGSTNIRLSGEATLRGRDLALGLKREAASAQNERLIPA
ncbi:MAG: hypothetical protein Q8921_15290 [Bacteroidota bacterium]|nr:hypothetical protein [Bacteroidota bacterium]